ncbi:MAG: hypothetical protein Q8S39_07295, partial [Ignavibacteria bacterium]|nr:hypothetical protein [Ignavibacteria bacterium]
RHKAVFFRKHGFDDSRIDFMISQLHNLLNEESIFQTTNEYGTKYVLRGFIKTHENNEIEFMVSNNHCFLKFNPA